jgi:LuxR family maltose regulon positive regulatory protein
VSHGNLEAGLLHAQAAEDWPQAVELMEKVTETELERGELDSLNRWLQAMPDEVVACYPYLQVLSGWVAYLLGNVKGALAITQRIENSGAPLPEFESGLLSGLHCQLILVQEQNREAIHASEDALRQIGERSPFIRGILLTSLASAEQSVGASQEAEAHFRQAARLKREAGNLLTLMIAVPGVIVELNHQGQHQQANEACLEALDKYSQAPTDAPVAAMLRLIQARLDLDGNLLDDAERQMNASRSFLSQFGLTGLLLSVDLLHAQILVAREQYPQAQRLLTDSRCKARSADYLGYLRSFDMLQADICLRTGALDAVEEWLCGAGLPAQPVDDPARESEYLLELHYLIEVGKTTAAAALAEALESHARSHGLKRLLAAVLLNRAVIARKTDELKATRACLQEAVQLAGPQGYVRILLDEGAPLLEAIVQLPEAPEALQAYLQPVNTGRSGAAVSALTSREVDVLVKIADNYTNVEIAKQLFLSPETVKAHLKHIFQKLAVPDRRQAVRRARELGLLK